MVFKDEFHSLGSDRRHCIVILYEGESNVQAFGGDLMGLGLFKASLNLEAVWRWLGGA